MSGAIAPRRPIHACSLCGSKLMVHRSRIGTLALDYLVCTDCGFITLPPNGMLSKTDERARYGAHRNSKSDPGYLRFLQEFIDVAAKPWIKPKARTLDFGSGPQPVLADLLRQEGYGCDIHDPMFARTRLWKRRLYDAILLHEVAEHFRDPATSFRVLASRIQPGGILAIRTRFLPDPACGTWKADFDSWWYRMDRTHVAFYRPESLLRFLGKLGFIPVLVKEPDMLVARLDPPR